MISLPSAQRCLDNRNDEHTELSSVPITTGASVIALKFENGIVLAADRQASFGSLARYKKLDRIVQANDSTLFAASGDIADFYVLKEAIEGKVRENRLLDDSTTLTPLGAHNWITGALYSRRTKLDPLWTNVLIAGMERGEPYLGTSTMLGQTYTSDCTAVGLGKYLCIAPLRGAIETCGNTWRNVSEAFAVDTVKKCMTTLFCRDVRASANYQMAILKEDGVQFSYHEAEANWDIATRR